MKKGGEKRMGWESWNGDDDGQHKGKCHYDIV